MYIFIKQCLQNITNIDTQLCNETIDVYYDF